MAHIAVLLAPDFEDSEYSIPADRLRQAGHSITVLGLQQGQKLTGKRRDATVVTDDAVASRAPDEFDAVVIPGGYSPDALRADDAAVDFVRNFSYAHKPIAAICHGPQLLIDAGLVKGRKVTSWPSIKKDLINAGATWVDHAVVVDGPVITSRKPADAEAFTSALLEQL